MSLSTSRRQFLVEITAIAAGLSLAGCQPVSAGAESSAPGPQAPPEPTSDLPGSATPVPSTPRSRVVVQRCDPRSDDALVESTVMQAARLLGRQVALTDPGVLRGTLAMIRRYYGGDLLIGEGTTGSSFKDLFARVGPDIRPYDARLMPAWSSSIRDRS
jgi:hypothetical protein